MSHVVSIKTELFDLNAAKAACAELGLIFKEGQKTIRWFGEWVNDYAADDAAYKLGISTDQYGKCDHAIEVPGSGYDIGLIHNPKTGGHKLYFDFYGSNGKKIQNAVGENGQKLLQYYGKHKVLIEAKKKGWLCSTTKAGNGNIEIQITNVA
jgi:hypothetical protein